MLCELGEDKVHSSFIIAIDTESTIGPMILHKLEYKASAEDIHLHSSLNFTIANYSQRKQCNMQTSIATGIAKA